MSRGLDLSEIKNVYPLVEIPRWISSRYFYDAVRRVAAYLLLPLLVVYAIYRGVALLLAILNPEISKDYPLLYFNSYQDLPLVHEFFVDLGIFALLTLLIFVIFFLMIRRVVRRTLASMSSKQQPRYSPAENSQDKICAILLGEAPPPMCTSMRSEDIDVFVSGHTHLPSLVELEKQVGRPAVMVNSGCWLRQLQPVVPHFKAPPVFVSRFVLTYVRVFVQDSSLRVELWEQPKPAEQHLTRIERLFSWNRRPPQAPPHSKPRIRAASTP